jgi:hypothetical protein
MADKPDTGHQGPDAGAPTDSPPPEAASGAPVPLSPTPMFLMPFTIVWVAGESG